MAITVGIDGGNYKIKVFGDEGELMFISMLGEYRDRMLEQTFSDDDIIWEFNGEKGFAGTLAQYESEYSRSIMGDSKAHSDLLIRVLLGLHRYSPENDFNIVVGQPISRHDKWEKAKIKDMLKGEHQFILNKVKKRINIKEVEVAAEGGAAFWSNPKKGLVRILDIGSGTVNAATLDDGRYIDKDSFTINYGMETNISKDIYAMAKAISAQALRKWRTGDTVFIVGGAANDLVEPLQDYFPNCSVLRPKIKTVGKNATIKTLDPVYANAVGFYNIGKGFFK